MQSNEAGNRSNIDDSSITPLNHVSSKHLARAKGAVQVCLQNSVPFFIADLQRRRSFGSACTIHDNVNRAELPQRRGKQLVETAAAGHITGDLKRSRAEAADR